MQEIIPLLPSNKIPKLAKFLTFQHTDHTWFTVTRPEPEQVEIAIRRTGREPSVENMCLKDNEAYALHDLLTMILERGIENAKRK